MKIHSIDKKSWFAVKPVKDNSYTAISVEAQIDVGHGVLTQKYRYIFSKFGCVHIRAGQLLNGQKYTAPA